MTKSGRINTDAGRPKIVSTNANAISLSKMTIMSMAKTLLASEKWPPPSVKIPAIWIIAFQVEYCLEILLYSELSKIL